MTPQYLVFAVGLVAIAGVAVAAMEIAVLSQIQQDADAIGCRNSQAANASQGRCVNPGPGAQAEDAEADGAADEEEDNEEDNSNDDDEEADDE
jgi:hypothetical protein